MLNNLFIQRYTSIPICRYESDRVTVTMPPNNHKDFEILLVKEGRGSITVNEETYDVKAGAMLLLSPYMLHGVSVPENSYIKYACLCFDLSLIQNESLISDLENGMFYMHPCIYPDSSHWQMINQAYLSIEQALLQAKSFWELMVQGHLNLLFAYLMQNSLYYKAKAISKDMAFCLHVMNYLEENYKTNITSKQIAESMHYTQSYFCRLFRKNFALCFNEYLCSFRLEKAKLLLANSKDISITHVVTEVGFLSASYFTKKFREENGISPTEFRKINLNHKE